MRLHVRFVTWNPLTSVYVPLPDGTRVRAVEGVLSREVASTTLAGGDAMLELPSEDVRFEVSLAGEAIDWRSGERVPDQTPASWTPPDPWPARLGHRRPRGRGESAADPFVIRMGRQAFLRFVRWDEEKGAFRPVAAGSLVSGWDANVLGDRRLASEETDADGRVALMLDEGGEAAPDLYFTVEAGDTRWSSRDAAGRDRPDRLGYWSNFEGQRVGTPEDPYVFAIDGDEARKRPGNLVSLLVDGPALLAAWEAAIASAEHTIHFEVMLYFEDPMTRRIQAKILEKARQGVKVRMLVGEQVTRTNTDFIQTEMIWAKAFRTFTPEERAADLARLDRKLAGERKRSAIDALLADLRAEPNVTVLDSSFQRFEALPGLHGALPDAYAELEEHLPFFTIARVDHRKALVVDGRVAVLGGQNVGEEYVYEEPFDPALSDETEPWTKWHDVSVRIEGPAVEDVQRRFRERWVSEGGDAFAEAGTVDGEPRNPAHPTFPRLDPRPGGLPVRIVDTTPGARFAFHATVLSLIRSARRTVHLMSPYFSSPEALGAITDAARRGVHVVFTLPDQRNDSIDFLYAGRLWYGELIEAGVEVYEYQNHMSHAKVAVVDEVAVVGSGNLNHSSFFHHYELAAVIEDAAFARDMRAALWERDRPWSRRIRPVDLPGLLDINAVCELYLRGIVHRRF